MTKNGNRRRYRALSWHRRLGLTALVLVALIAATGLLLNHTESLGLDRGVVTNEWILDWYGVAPKRDPVSFATSGGWVTWVDGHLFLDGQQIAEDVGEAKGAVAMGEIVAFAGESEVLLFTGEGELIERMGMESLPGTVSAIGRNPGKYIMLQTAAGRFRSDEEFVSWKAADNESEWSRPAPLPEPVRERVLTAYRGHSLPLGRVLLDIHTGRIFGSFGPYLMDAAAVCLVILGITGVINWVRGFRAR